MIAPAPHAIELKAKPSPLRTMNAADAIGLPVERAPSLLPTDLIRDDEVVILMMRPSPLFIPLGSLGSLSVIAALAFALAYVARLFPSFIGWSDVQAFSLGVALAAIRLGWQMLEWYSRVYVLTDRRIIRRFGVLRVYIFEAPLKNIQHTGVFTRLRERVFGLGSIGFATSGSDTFDAFWVMLRNPFRVHKRVMQAIDRYGRH